MEADDLEPRARKAAPRVLDDMSVEALADYIGELEAEIERVRATIRQREAQRNRASGLFKS